MGTRSQLLLAALLVAPLASCTPLKVDECQADADCTWVQQCDTGKGRCVPAPLPATTVESGFKMEQHAFPFSNFGGADPDSVMKTPLLERMHGKQAVCAAQAGECRLRPAAKEYQRLINRGLGGGRCEGFAVLSTLMFDGSLNPADFGAASARDLELDGNVAMKEELAYWFASQYLRDVVPPSTKMFDGEGALRFLTREFSKPQHSMYRMGIARVGSDGKLTGGHAMVPIAVSPAGPDGKYVIKLYDNNHPEEARDMVVDVSAGSWEYQASTNPNNAGALYRGDAGNKNKLFIAETQPRTGRHPCAFCEGTAADVQQVFCSGGVSMNATDDTGAQAGEVDGVIVTDIAGSMVVPDFSAFTYEERTATQLILPGRSLNLTLRPSGTMGPQEPLEVHAFSPGMFTSVSGMQMADGQQARLGLTEEGSVTFAPAAPGASNLVLGRSTPDGQDVMVEVALPESGSVDSVQVTMAPDTGSPSIQVNSPAAEMVRVSVTRSTEASEETFSAEVTMVPGSTSTFHVDAWDPSGSMPVDVDNNGDGTPDQSVDIPSTGTENTAPTAPTSLVLVAAEHDRVSLGWAQDSTTESGFELERDSGLGFVLHAVLPANSTAHIDTNVVRHSRTYRYRVRATNPYGASEYSNTVETTTAGCPTQALDGNSDGICSLCGDATCSASDGETSFNCLADCPVACGDNEVGPGEACDDGVGNSDLVPDACRLDCTLPRCGDGTADTGELCDDGNATDTDACLATCTPNTCGDGFVNPAAEQCDLGAANSDTLADTCRTSCRNAGCGDGVTDTGETCDDGNPSNADTCLNTCVPNTCGDGFVNAAAEQCDDGAANSDTGANACRTSCQAPRCGDGVRDNGEACDDGNQVNEDACLSSCVLNTCGDGFVSAGVEACDDGNRAANDGCSPTCRLDCGDGRITGAEQCDDFNGASGDGCSSSCAVEPGFACALSPNLNTGTDGAGGTLGTGTPDLTWTWSSTLGGTESAAILAGACVPGWRAAFADAAWVNRGSCTAAPGLDTYYRAEFIIASPQELLRTRVNARVWADHQILDIYVNGVATGLRGEGTGQLAGAGILIGNWPSSLLIVGVNTVVIAVHNDAAAGANAEGILVKSAGIQGASACTSTAAPTLGIQSLDATGCSAADVSSGGAFTARGGLALGYQELVCMPGNQPVSVASESPGNVSAVYAATPDALVTDTSTDQLYSFTVQGAEQEPYHIATMGNALAQCAPVALGGLAPMNPQTTGLLFGASVPFVDGVTGAPATVTALGGCRQDLAGVATAVFSGPGFTLVYAPGTGLYRIETATGRVWLSGVTDPAEPAGLAAALAEANRCASWALGGVAERDASGSVNLVYIAGNEVRRFRLSDGQVTVVNALGDLGNACSLMVSGRQQRWWTVSQGQSQFLGAVVGHVPLIVSSCPASVLGGAAP